jgi:capsular exopolysaccharide synthesis family protein
MELMDQMSALWARKWGIAAIALLAGALGFLTTSQDGENYRAAARLVVTPFGDGVPGQSDTVNVVTESEILRSMEVAEAVISDLGLDRTQQELIDAVDVASVPNSEVLVVGFTSSDPQVAAEVPSAFASEYFDLRRAAAEAAVSRALDRANTLLESATTQLERVKRRLASATERRDARSRTSLQAAQDVLVLRVGNLQDAVFDLESQDVRNEGGRIVSSSPATAQLSSHSRLRNAVLGTTLGLFLGIGVMLLLEFILEPIRTRTQLERVTKVPVLAQIPDLGRRGGIASSQGVFDAFHTLRARLEFKALDNGVRSVTITSPHDGEGKTTTVAQLGRSLARSGRRVTLLSCERGKASLEHVLGIQGGPQDGLAAWIERGGDEPLPLTPTEHEGLSVVPAGDSHIDISTLLSSPLFPKLLSHVEQECDVLIVDSPALANGSAASLIARSTDASILLVSARKGRKRDVLESVDTLAKVGASPIGTILNLG